MDIEKAKLQLNAPKEKHTKMSSGLKWEIAAYAVRAISTATPAVIVMFMENSWVKSGLGLTATVLLVALAIIFKEPLKKAMNYAPGVIPFTIFVIIAIFFNTTAKALLAIGISGLGGSIVAIPLHAKYLAYTDDTESPELQALKAIAKKLK